jgi:Ca-activated chloride channel family protein
MPHPIYVPIVHTGRCEKPRDGLDIVLVVDTSSSMKLPTHEGGPMKVTAAVAAAREFVRLMTNPDDRLGAVQFNNSARVLSELTRDREAVRESLHGVTVQVGTRIDAGLDTAGGVLARADYDPDRRPVIVLLTDGRPTASRASHVFMAAQRLRGFGVTVYAIGLGPDADPNLLRILATSPGYYFFAPGTQELTAVYRQVAAKIPPPCE